MPCQGTDAIRLDLTPMFLYHHQARKGLKVRSFIIFALLLGCSFSKSSLAEKDAGKIDYAAVGDVPLDTMREIEKVVDAHRARIIDNFNVESMPAVTVRVWQDRDEFEQSYGDDAEFVQGYVSQDKWEARFFNGRPDIGLGVVHEYTHLVTLAINPTFDNNPRWLWEATAIYESGRPPVPDVSKLNCFAAGHYPTIESLDEHPLNIYKVGYFLADFIVSKWGQEKMVALVKSNGDIDSTLGVTVREFESAWLIFLQDNHELEFGEEPKEDC